MSKLIELAKKFQVKLAQVADPAAPVTPPTQQDVSKLQDAQKLQEAGEAVKKDLAVALGFHAPKPDDFKFSKLRFVTAADGKKSLEWALMVSQPAVQQYNAGVANQRKGNPSFSVPTYVSQLFVQKLPGVPVLPAQPITVG